MCHYYRCQFNECYSDAWLGVILKSFKLLGVIVPLSIILPNNILIRVILLNGISFSVIQLKGISFSVIQLNGILFEVILLNDILLSILILSILLQSVILPSAIHLIAIGLNVVAPIGRFFSSNNNWKVIEVKWTSNHLFSKILDAFILICHRGPFLQNFLSVNIVSLSMEQSILDTNAGKQ